MGPWKFALGFCSSQERQRHHHDHGHHDHDHHDHGHHDHGHHDHGHHDHDHQDHGHHDHDHHDHDHHDHGHNDRHGETIVSDGVSKVSESSSPVHEKNDLYFPMNVLSLFFPGMTDDSSAPRLKRLGFLSNPQA